MAVQRIEITSKTIVNTIFYLIGFWLLYQVRSIVVTIFVAFIFMTAISPIIKAAKKIKIPTLVVVLALFVGLIALFTTLIVSLMPAIMAETSGLIQNFPHYIDGFNQKWSLTIDQGIFTNQLGDIPTNILNFAVGAFSNVILIMAVFFMTYYLSEERPRLHHYLKHFFRGDDQEERAERLVNDVETRVGGWVRGELFLMSIIGIMSFIGLTILHIPYALPLAILAGLLEAVPSIGPTISAVPAIILGLSISPLTGLGALAMSIIIQQSENNLIVPRVMQHVVGVRPIVTIVVLMTGFTLGGVMGAVLAMPIFLALTSIYREFNN
jgi:predicted PurR-regulated permease PerM